jgi:hypothetical protein
MSTHDFNAIISTKAAALKAYRAANLATRTAQKAFDDAQVAAGIKPGPRPRQGVVPVPVLPPAPTPTPVTDWDALAIALTNAKAAEAPLQAAYTAAKKAQDDAEKDVGAQ